MLQILSAQDIAQRRSRGVYYTSERIAEELANWAIRTPDTRILEPSFGGGAFVYAALSRLAALRSTVQCDQIVGYDIDDKARTLLLEKLPSPENAVLVSADFLSVVPPSSTKGQFDCIIGNPPFVRHHRNKHSSFKNRCEELGLPKSADLWCLFVLHALKFLKRGGRLALVLPASFLFADYAQAVRDVFRSQFGKVRIVRLAFNSFANEGAEEKGILILADSFKAQESRAWSEAVAWCESDLSKVTLDSYVNSPTPAAEFAELIREVHAVQLQELATVRIGVVTGANRFFVINDALREKYCIPRKVLLPIVGRTAQITSLRFGLREHAVAAKDNQRVWLLSPGTIGTRSDPVRRYLETMPDKIRSETLWFRKRENWFQPEPIYADALFTYMNHHGPKIAIVSEKITATNTFHLLTLKSRHRYDKRKLALGILTSLSQASAEIEGRAYGGGLLKIEPAGLKRILLPKHDPTPEILDAAFVQADAYLRAGDPDSARQIADRTLLFPALGKNPENTTVSLQRVIQYSRQIRTNVAKHNLY